MLSKVFILFFLTFLNEAIISQTGNTYLAETRLIIQSQDLLGKPFTAHSEFAYMVLNLSTGDFTLNTDLSNIKTGDAYLDSSVKAQGQQPFSFKGNMRDNLFLFNQLANDEKDYNMQGQLSIKETSIPCIAQYDPVNYGEKTDNKSYRMDFKLTVDASKISILGLQNKTNKELLFEVIGGKLNTQL